MLSVSSRKRVGDVKFAIWSARNTVHSLPGSSIPAATTARHPRPVPLGRAFASVANGMPYRSSYTRQRESARSGSYARTAASLASSRSPIITSRHRSCSRKRHSSTRSAGFAEYAHGQPASV